MSNIGKQPIKIKEGVSIAVDDRLVIVTGPKGNLSTKLPIGINIEIIEGELKVKKAYDDKDLEKYLGLSRALLSNSMTGVTEGFDKKLELHGVGYRARVEGGNLILNVGFAHAVIIKPLEGTTIQVADGGIITVSGINKQHVGDVSADIRRVRPPDPYKGKGIRYQGEKLRKKLGKSAKAAGGK